MTLEDDIKYLRKGNELRKRPKPVRIRTQDRAGHPDKMYVVTKSDMEPVEVCYNAGMAKTLAATIGGLYKLVPVRGESYLFE